MNKTPEELQFEISELNAKAFRLFDEAKQIQSQITGLPVVLRKNAMDKVYALQKEAIAESQKSSALKHLLA